MAHQHLFLSLILLTLPAYAIGASKLHADLGGAEQVTTTAVAGPGGTSVTIPVGPLVSGGSGMAHFKLSPDRSMLNYRIEASGTGSPLFMGHIHLGPRGANGPVMFWLFGDQSNAPFPLPRNDGPWTGEISGIVMASDLVAAPALGINTFDEAIANILRGNAYVNFHTVVNVPGELRGQINSHRMVTQPREKNSDD